MTTPRGDIQLCAAFQPIVDRNFTTVAHEALARPVDSESPETLAMRAPTGLLIAMLELSAAAFDDLATPVFVNVDPASFNDRAVDLVALFAAARFASDIHVEVTERGLLDRHGLTVVHQLHQMGCEIWLDDFGTQDSTMAGRSALLDADVVAGVKIDKDAVAGTTASVLAHCDVVVLQEGIESIEQARRAWAGGATLLQGYLIGEPLTREHNIRTVYGV